MIICTITSWQPIQKLPSVGACHDEEKIYFNSWQNHYEIFMNRLWQIYINIQLCEMTNIQVPSGVHQGSVCVYDAFKLFYQGNFQSIETKPVLLL